MYGFVVSVGIIIFNIKCMLFTNQCVGSIQRKINAQKNIKRSSRRKPPQKRSRTTMPTNNRGVHLPHSDEEDVVIPVHQQIEEPSSEEEVEIVLEQPTEFVVQANPAVSTKKVAPSREWT